MINIDDLIWVELDREEDFLIVKETLTRIGVASKSNKTLYQSCHILHKRGRYAIVHFKELFLLDGKNADFSEEDIGRRNTIVNLLEEWELITQVDPEKTETPRANMASIKVIPAKEKAEWTLVPKYTIGAKGKH